MLLYIIIASLSLWMINNWVATWQNPTKWHVRPAKTQISLGIHSESSLCAQAKDPSFLHVDSEDFDQTGWMPRLVQGFH